MKAGLGGGPSGPLKFGIDRSAVQGIGRLEAPPCFGFETFRSLLLVLVVPNLYALAAGDCQILDKSGRQLTSRGAQSPAPEASWCSPTSMNPAVPLQGLYLRALGAPLLICVALVGYR